MMLCHGEADRTSPAEGVAWTVSCFLVLVVLILLLVLAVTVVCTGSAAGGDRVGTERIEIAGVNRTGRNELAGET